MPKCEVTTNDGEHTQVEADGYQLLPDTGFVLLKRREKVEGQPDRESTVAIFYRPSKVLLPMPDGSVNGTLG